MLSVLDGSCFAEILLQVLEMSVKMHGTQVIPSLVLDLKHSIGTGSQGSLLECTLEGGCDRGVIDLQLLAMGSRSVCPLPLVSPYPG